MKYQSALERETSPEAVEPTALHSSTAGNGDTWAFLTATEHCKGWAQGIKQVPQGCSDDCSLAKRYWINIRYKGNTFYLQLCIGQHWNTITSLSYSTPFWVQVFCVSTINTNILPLLAAKCEKSKCRSQVVSNAMEFPKYSAEIMVVFQDHTVSRGMDFRLWCLYSPTLKEKGRIN